ncbi:replication initiation negative regulator SeqA [Shewanella dokdonensis]|uniref:Negative modulator of initiation of replication n=1 Tax=Shewanella dokdonensis TaxID=712036 RepID=A0ABX8DE91_9GAMM|nr:replication initiation negative regulator SeqA [Shewanella dokdonensis]MCL1073044.1 replication initiation negative regulator SeqA [Shewanella dokdonensis]QVK23054.1 replication initiation negative regulator SeqA [Shewanella dokdonensis]
MKYIEVDEELYRFIAGKTERIGESASEILRRLLGLESLVLDTETPPVAVSHPGMESSYLPNNLPPASNAVDFEQLYVSSVLDAQKSAVGRFLFVLEALYQQMPQQFEKVLQVQGRDRLYFATSKASLLAASQSANPKEIGNSGYWVTTNNNTAKKHAILLEALEKLGCGAIRAQAIADEALPQAKAE